MIHQVLVAEESFKILINRDKVVVKDFDNYIQLSTDIAL